MDARFINPFLQSVLNVLNTMGHMDAKPGKPMLKKDDEARGDVTGLIGLTSPQTKGSMAITFTKPVALELTKRMLGDDLKEIDQTVTDLVGEITNMVTGGAKQRLEQLGFDFDMAIPAIVAGKNHTIKHKSGGPKILLPFETERGKFYVEICFDTPIGD